MMEKLFTEKEKISFIVHWEFEMIKAISNGHKASDDDQFAEARKKITEYRKELRLIRDDYKK